MKTKRDNMFAKLPVTEVQKAKNYSGEKETIARLQLIDKKTERCIVDARLYMASGRNANRVHCSIWCNSVDRAFYTSGYGNADGYGYHKQSAALQAAIDSAGIELYGSPYNRKDPDENKKRRARIDGCGDTAMNDAILAMGYALGCKDGILV